MGRAQMDFVSWKVYGTKRQMNSSNSSKGRPKCGSIEEGSLKVSTLEVT